VAAGEIGDRSLDVARLDAEALDPTLRVGAQFAGAYERRELGQGEVLGDGTALGEAFAFAIFAEEADAVIERCAWIARAAPRARPDLAAHDPVQAEYCPQQLGAPRADEAGDAEDLAPMKRERCVARTLSAGDTVDMQQNVTLGVRRAGEQLGHVATG